MPLLSPWSRSVMALGSCLGDESHKGIGRVENVERAPGMGGARVSRGHPGRSDLHASGEATRGLRREVRAERGSPRSLWGRGRVTSGEGCG